MPVKENNAPKKLSSSYLTQKAAGYHLAAGNAMKSENKSSSSSKNKSNNKK
jgi:hypothetical protein